MASSNGKIVESNDRVVVTPERSRTRRTSRFRWTVGLLVRLCIWYFLLTPFFRCPSNVNDLTDSSPRICKPYLVAKSYAEPHVAPYYNVYAAPYVDAARPYVRVVNEKVYIPASNIAKQGYDTYGAPALDKAQAYGQKQWDANVVPHIQNAKGKATDWYEAQVAPHVNSATTVVYPYYQKAYGAYWAILDGYLMPFAAKYQPFIGKTYSSSQEILTTTVMPHAQNAWSSTIHFVNYSLWPKVSSLYSENVEPQLVKIGQRLASYREGSRLRGVADEVESSAGYSAVTTSTSVVSNKLESSTTSTVLESTPTPSLSPAQLAAQVRDKITSDLINWKNRFASASEKGVEGLEGRIVEIVDTHIAGGAQSEGDKRLAALEGIVEDQTTTVKRHINTLVESLPFADAPEQEEAAVEELLKQVRNSAVSIRDRAHVLREWHATFEQELVQKVSLAVNSTLAVLDNVRDLGLQEIGMRWAWMEGVTYKDWEDYHALKEEFEDWKAKFRDIGLQHARIEAVKDTAEETLSRGMDIAEAAARELTRLKEVGEWKIAAREASEDFDTRSVPPPPLPKPTPDAENIPEQEEEQEVQAEAEESVFSENQFFDENDIVVDTDTEADAESPELDEVQVPNENQDNDFDATTKDESQNDVESPEPSVDAKGEPEADPFGAAAAAVLLEKAAAGIDDADKLDHDEAIVDSEATKISEALSESLGVDDINAAPMPSQEPEQQQSIEDLLSHILADTDSAFAQKVMKRLNDIYESPQLRPESKSTVEETEPSSSTADAIDNEATQEANANEHL
ncbi:hypothetical protein BDV18DRAFT_116055 [Aspergillus unguis]